MFNTKMQDQLKGTTTAKGKTIAVQQVKKAATQKVAANDEQLLQKAAAFVIEVVEDRFDNPVTYQDKRFDPPVAKQSQIVRCVEIGNALAQIAPDLLGTSEQRIEFYNALKAQGLVKNAWAGRKMPALASVRYVQESNYVAPAIGNILDKYLPE